MLIGDMLLKAIRRGRDGTASFAERMLWIMTWFASYMG